MSYTSSNFLKPFIIIAVTVYMGYIPTCFTGCFETEQEKKEDRLHSLPRLRVDLAAKREFRYVSGISHRRNLFIFPITNGRSTPQETGKNVVLGRPFVGTPVSE